MAQAFEEIIRDLKNKIFHPIYLLHGEESYYIDMISDYIEAHTLDDMSKEFNQSVVYGRDVDLLSLISMAKRFPMMSDYQVLIVKEAQDLKSLFKKEKEEDKSAAKKKDEKEIPNPFEAYVQNPQKSTILVLCYKYTKVDARTKIFKQIVKTGVTFESKKIYDNEVPGWCVNVLKFKNYSISPKASQLLADYLGNDLSKISNELDKLMLNVKPGNEITAEHIEKNIGISKDFNVFELQQAIGSKDNLKANRIVNYFAANPKNNPLVLTMANLYSFFSKLLLYQTMKGATKGELASALAINPYFMDQYVKAAKNYGPEKLVTIISLLREYDLKSKGVNAANPDDGELLKEAVFRIMH